MKILNGEFVNRKNETQFMKEWVTNFTGRNEGIFVYAASGIGKSRFISNLFDSEFPDYIKIKVAMYGADKSSSDSYSFLSRLYRKTIEVTETNSELPLLKRASISAGLSLSYLGEISISFLDKKGYGEQINHIMSYLTHKLSGKKKYIINIENYHLIDSESFECLLHLFRIGTQHRFIFELTEDPQSLSSTFFKIFTETKAILPCKLYELQKLTMQEVTILCEKSHISVESGAQIYEAYSGNLLPLIMLAYTPEAGALQTIADVVDSLDRDQKIILFIVELMSCRTTLRVIQEAFLSAGQILAGSDKYMPMYIEEQCTELLSRGLITQNEQFICIDQNQVAEVIRTYRRHPDYYLAWSLCENFFNGYRKSTLSNRKEASAFSLLHLYVIFPDAKVYTILPEVTSAILQGPPEKSIRKIASIYEQLKKSKNNPAFTAFLAQFLVDVCIAVGQWDTAYEIVSTAYTEDVPWQACYWAATLAANPQKSDVEQRILQLQARHKANLMAYMSITVSLFSYYLRTKPEKDVKCLGEQLVGDFAEYENINYAFLLKMLSNTQSNDQALVTLKRANTIFEKYDRSDLTIMNLITVASRNAYKGEFALAEKLLEDIDRKACELNIPIRKHYILNNKCAIMLAKSEFSPRIETDLKSAYYSCGSSFEKAIILCNLLIYYTHANNKAEAKTVFETLHNLDLSHYDNVDLDFTILKNTWYFYSHLGNQNKTLLARKKLITFARSKKCPNDIKLHIIHLFSKEFLNSDCQEVSYFSSLPFQPEFIGYWQFEVCYELNGKNRIKDILDFQGK